MIFTDILITTLTPTPADLEVANDVLPQGEDRGSRSWDAKYKISIIRAEVYFDQYQNKSTYLDYFSSLSKMGAIGAVRPKAESL